MGPLGHIGITLGAAHVTNLATPLRLSLWIVAFAALLPDLIDKPLYILGIGDGRFIGHTLLFICIVSAVLYIKNKKYALVVMFGSVCHLVFDMHGFVPWLYPFISHDFTIVFDPGGIYARLLIALNIAGGVYISPVSLITELIGLLILFGILCYAIWRYFKTKGSIGWNVQFIRLKYVTYQMSKLIRKVW